MAVDETKKNIHRNLIILFVLLLLGALLIIALVAGLVERDHTYKKNTETKEPVEPIEPVETSECDGPILYYPYTGLETNRRYICTDMLVNMTLHVWYQIEDTRIEINLVDSPQYYRYGEYHTEPIWEYEEVCVFFEPADIPETAWLAIQPETDRLGTVYAVPFYNNLQLSQFVIVDVPCKECDVFPTWNSIQTDGFLWFVFYNTCETGYEVKLFGGEDLIPENIIITTNDYNVSLTLGELDHVKRGVILCNDTPFLYFYY